jgi:hypothetical protein
VVAVRNSSMSHFHLLSSSTTLYPWGYHPASAVGAGVQGDPGSWLTTAIWGRWREGNIAGVL